MKSVNQETYVRQKVTKLQREGLWSLKMLPKAQDPPRIKAHWDYLLEEMTWLAIDFDKERKWKKEAAKKCAGMILKYHIDKEIKEKEKQQKLKKVANQLAQKITQFWVNIEKLVKHKQWQEEILKKASDMHSNFIVDQMESNSWQTQRMKCNYLDRTSTASSSGQGLQEANPKWSQSQNDKFKQEKIKREVTTGKEVDGVNEYEQSEEIKLLQEKNESFLKDTFEGLAIKIEKQASPLLREEKTKHHFYAKTQANKAEDIDPYKIVVDSDENLVVHDEFGVIINHNATFLTQEEKKINSDYAEEPRDKQIGNKLSTEKLCQKNAVEIPKSGINEREPQLLISDVNILFSDKEVDYEKLFDDALVHVNNGVEYIILPFKEKYQEEMLEKDGENSRKELTETAIIKGSFQPKENALYTKQVITKIPSLLKHKLREYQHIGLDWLSALHNKKLNGILANETGLGKTIETIALLAHLACDKGIWGPHLIVVPTSVMLHWETEFKKWCPALKVLTYYGTREERRLKINEWTKPNAFHVYVTSYNLVVQDKPLFQMTEWIYFILDEAQHVKNLEDQSWQILFNIKSSHRLVLTGSPLQNGIMELLPFVRFLTTPNIFQSYRECFVNPVSGMIKGSHEHYEKLVKRFCQVLKPCILRRVKSQLPKKHEHIILCKLSKRQRYLYDDFMLETKTKETLASGSFMSVIRILIQLRKICNHPDLFEEIKAVPSFKMEGFTLYTPSVVWNILDHDPLKHISLWSLNLLLADLEFSLTAFSAYTIKELYAPISYIEKICDKPGLPRKCPGKFKSSVHISTATSNSRHSSIARTSTPVHISINKRVRVKSFNIHTKTNNSIQATFVRNEAQGVKLPIIHPLSMSLTRAENLSNSFTSEKMSGHFFMKSLALRQQNERKNRLHMLGRINRQRCAAVPFYGDDLVRILTVTDKVKPSKNKRPRWNRGYVNCLNAPYIEKRARSYWRYTKALSDIVVTPEHYIQEFSSVINSLLFVTPAVTAPYVQFHISHPSPSKTNVERQRVEKLATYLSPCFDLLNPIIKHMRIQFPELKPIHYNCGKLQTLNKLLWYLKGRHHRVLIFTQMVTVLDILQQFLNYHGHTYLRLDSNTTLSQKQTLIEQFNEEKHIFCFIMSTRSGEISVNLTGADTIIFYDSDWNPTMEAQSQDICNKISQTKDINVYRLISEKTVEENILTKANQKGLFDDLLVEGGNFTTAFFKKNAIDKLFGIATHKNMQFYEVNAEAKMLKTLNKEHDLFKKFSCAQLQKALGVVEEDVDFQAAEAATKLGKFDESTYIESDNRENEEFDRLKKLINQLRPVEKYAMRFLESLPEPLFHEQLNLTEETTEAKKEVWELEYLTEKEKCLLNFIDRPLPYCPIDACNQIWATSTFQNENGSYEDCSKRSVHKHSLPSEYHWPPNNNSHTYNCCDTFNRIRLPPTPPKDENDFYIDSSLEFLYELKVSPNINERAETVKDDRIHGAVVATHKQKVRKDERVLSLLDQPTVTIHKMKYELIGDAAVKTKPLRKLEPLKQTPIIAKPSSHIHKGIPKWMIHEDISLLQCKELCGEKWYPNWDFVADAVNSVSTYRTPNECKSHYESVIFPREKKIHNTKPKRTKISKVENNELSKTRQLYLKDRNKLFTAAYNHRIETISTIAHNRNKPSIPLYIRNPEQSSSFTHIEYEQTLNPVQIVARMNSR